MMEPIVNIAVQLARQAGEHIRRQQEKVSFLEINYKADNSESTIVDLQAENIIIQGVRKKFPQHNILSEEQGFLDAQSDTTWIIDALDGTKNFLHGIAHFSVSIAVKVKNQLEHAVIFDPIRHECFTASRGRGAQLNNRRIRVSQTTQLNRALVAVGKRVVSLNTKDTLNFHQKSETLISSSRRMGCASLDLAYVACGRFDGFYGENLHDWDVAAGMLLIQESGGIICDYQGKSQALPSKNMMAANLKLAKTWLNEVF